MSHPAEANGRLPEWWRYRNRVILLVLVMVGLSWGWLISHGASSNENFNMGLARDTNSDLASQTAEAGQLPLYGLIMRLLFAWVGPGLTAARLASVGFFVATVIVAYFASRDIADERRAGYLAAGLMALSPYLVWFSDKATPYALVALVTVTNQWLFVRILRGGRWVWVGYIISALLGLFTHYFFILVVVTQWLFLLMKRAELPPLSRWLGLVSAAVDAAAVGLWLNFAASQGTFWTRLAEGSTPSAADVFTTFEAFLFGFQTVALTTFILAFWPLLVITALLAVQKHLRLPLAVEYFTLAALVPVAVAFGLSQVWEPIYVSNYLIVALPAFIMLVSWFLTSTDLRALRWFRNVLIMGMLAAVLLELFYAQTPIQLQYGG